jgi:hypothetical protein
MIKTRDYNRFVRYDIRIRWDPREKWRELTWPDRGRGKNCYDFEKKNKIVKKKFRAESKFCKIKQRRQGRGRRIASNLMKSESHLKSFTK